MKKETDRESESLVINQADRYKTLHDEVTDLMKLWNLVTGYDEKCFITRRISTLQNEALVVLREARLEFESATFQFRTVKD